MPVSQLLLQATPLEEQLEALSRAVVAGKVLHVGLSNETPWGLMKALAAGTVCCAEHLSAGGSLSLNPLAALVAGVHRC